MRLVTDLFVADGTGNRLARQEASGSSTVRPHPCTCSPQKVARCPLRSYREGPSPARAAAASAAAAPVPVAFAARRLLLPPPYDV